MRVRIDDYKRCYTPYDVAKKICFWAKPVKDKYGIEEEPQWVHDFGEWLAHGSIEPEDQVGERKKLFGKERPITWFYKLLLWFQRGERRIEVRIDPWDSYSADHTLGLIILPVLKDLKEHTKGAPYVDDDDVPDELKSTAVKPKENEWDTDDNHFKRWDWVLDQMIWSFENVVDDDWEMQFHTGEIDMQFEKQEDGNYLMVRGEKDTSHYDADGAKAYAERIDNGLRLFGKYYRNLWS